MKNRILLFLVFFLLLLSLTACTETIGGTTASPSGDTTTQGIQDEKESTEKKGEPQTPASCVSVLTVSKTATNGNIDTYTISFSDGTKSTFTVTNGVDGQSVYITSVEKESSDGLTDAYVIRFSNNTEQRFSVTNGQSITIQSIGKTGTQGLVDTYTISFSDGKSLSFTVTNGADGLTPYIGVNGNWWIGTEDTGVRVEEENMDRVGTDG